MLRVRAGTVAPPLSVPLHEYGEPVNLAQAEKISVVGIRDDLVAFQDDSPALDVTRGIVTHDWKPEETAERGRIWVTVRVVWPGPGVQTFPEFESIAVDVY